MRPQQVAKRNQALQAVRHWRWETRQPEQLAPGGRRSGSPHLLLQAEPDNVGRRFEPELRMMRAGHLRCSKRNCLEWAAGSRFEVGNVEDEVHLRIVHPL